MLMGMTRKSKKVWTNILQAQQSDPVTQWLYQSCAVSSASQQVIGCHAVKQEAPLPRSSLSTLSQTGSCSWRCGRVVARHAYTHRKKNPCKTRARSTNMRMNPARWKTNGCQTFCSRETDRHVTDPEGNCKQKMKFLPYARAATNTSDISLTYWFFHLFLIHQFVGLFLKIHVYTTAGLFNN